MLNLKSKYKKNMSYVYNLDLPKIKNLWAQVITQLTTYLTNNA
jgi:hypothetical protein